MTIQETTEKLLKEYKVLWTDWKILDNNKMERVENESAKWLMSQLINKAFEAGFKRAEQIIDEIRRKA